MLVMEHIHEANPHLCTRWSIPEAETLIHRSTTGKTGSCRQDTAKAKSDPKRQKSVHLDALRAPLINDGCDASLTVHRNRGRRER